MKLQLLAVAIAFASTVSTNATMVMPDLSNVPTSWTIDRYDPASFSNVGPYKGRTDVLGIGITSAGDSAKRPAGQQGSFYNTQGRQYPVTGGADSVLSADLFIPASWSSEANGTVRTDIWGVMTAGTSVSAYPIIGFSNSGGTSRLRVFDGNTAGDGWVNLATSVNYDAWTTLAIGFTGSSFVFSVNGHSVYEDKTIDGTTGFSAVIMQAYNFASISGANLQDYTANWSNTPVPEPSTYLV
jgi:hypothetical protein